MDLLLQNIVKFRKCFSFEHDYPNKVCNTVLSMQMFSDTSCRRAIERVSKKLDQNVIETKLFLV